MKKLTEVYHLSVFTRLRSILDAGIATGTLYCVHAYPGVNMVTYPALMCGAGYVLYKNRTIKRLRNENEAKSRRIEATYNDTDVMNHLRRYWHSQQMSEEYVSEKARADGYGVTLRWYKHAWPLTQVSITILTAPGTLVESIPAALRAATAYQEDTLSNALAHALPLKTMTAFVNVKPDAECPSLWENGCGIHTKPETWKAVFGETHGAVDGHDTLTILLQRIRPIKDNQLIHYLTYIAERIEKGELTGTDHDDGCGWAFCTFPAAGSSGI